ncbi:MAG: hypothetical protein WA215_14245 [Candidatus Cybelea sp.]
MRRIDSCNCVAAICAILVVAVASPGRSWASTGPLTDKMAAFNYLIGGSWKCSTKAPAVGARPAHTEQITVVFSLAPGNTVHSRVSGPGYSRDRYYGYKARSRLYWAGSVDNQGSYGFETSRDGVTYAGSTWFGGMSLVLELRNTLAKVNANEFTTHQVLIGGRLQIAVDAVCTR